MYNIKLKSSNYIHCHSAEETLNSLIQYFTNFKALFSKPFDNSNINYHNICVNILNYNLKIFYQNERRLKTKLVRLICSFPMFYFYDIIILTETWLSPNISESELGFFGFQVIRLDRNPNNSSFLWVGGVLIAIKTTLNFHPVSLNVSKVSSIF